MKPNLSANTNARRLVELRSKLGLSQRAMATYFRVRHTAISQWESGKREVPGPILALMEMYERELAEGKRRRREELKSIPSTRMGRALGATTVVGQALGQSLTSLIFTIEDSEHRRDAAEETLAKILTEKMGQHKGLLMKVGQAISYLNFSWNEETREIFADLQATSQSFDVALIEREIENAFGVSPHKLFLEWNPQPISAASIGQVHYARLKQGTEVAVKVQYPKIEKAIKADLSNATLVHFLVTLLYREQTTGTLIKELKERLLDECDYRKEQDSQEHFREAFKDEHEFIIPKVYPELTRRNIITMDFCYGKTLDEYVLEASQEELDKAGERIYRFAHQSIFKHRMFNGDPQPGNYLFSPDAVTFLDFGCVKKFNTAFVNSWKKLALAVLDRQEKRIEEVTLEMGLVKEPAKFDWDFYRKILYLYYQPLMEDRPFQFTQ